MTGSVKERMLGKAPSGTEQPHFHAQITTVIHLQWLRKILGYLSSLRQLSLHYSPCLYQLSAVCVGILTLWVIKLENIV